MRSLNFALVAYAITIVFAMLIALGIQLGARFIKQLGLREDGEPEQGLAPAAVPSSDEAAVAVAIAVAKAKQS